MSETGRYHEANRLSWNAATRAHNTHKGDQARFFREGGSTLFDEERELLGDLRGQDLVHLQCNAGQDTLSLARLGANVTGIDISDEAIDFAQKLSADSGIAAAFYRADIYDWLDDAARDKRAFDVVFCSYGAICWLSDITRWAAGVAGVLRPGGRLVVVDFHPTSMIFDENWVPKYPYSTAGRPHEWTDGIGDYVALAGEALAIGGYHEGVTDFRNPHPSYEFGWGIGDILSAVLAAGLRLEQFREYPYSNGARLFEEMRELPGRRFAPPDRMPNIPLMYGLVARSDP